MYINKTNWPTSRRGSFVTCRRWGMESAGSSHSKERWLDNTCIFHWWRKKETSNVWKIMMNGRTTVSRGNRTIGWCPISRFHWITWAPCTIVRVNLLRSQLLGHRAWRKRWVIVNRSSRSDSESHPLLALVSSPSLDDSLSEWDLLQRWGASGMGTPAIVMSLRRTRDLGRWGLPTARLKQDRSRLIVHAWVCMLAPWFVLPGIPKFKLIAFEAFVIARRPKRRAIVKKWDNI